MNATAFAALMLLSLAAPAFGEANPKALADCVRAADQKYKDTWEALCVKSGKIGHCNEFIGSPRDKEFSQLRIEEMQLCSTLYNR